MGRQRTSGLHGPARPKQPFASAYVEQRILSRFLNGSLGVSRGEHSFTNWYPPKKDATVETMSGDQQTRRHELARHDTPRWLSETLVRSLKIRPPASIVDLGAGGGSLALAALRRWSSAQMLTVDVDSRAADELALAFAHARTRHRHVIADALRPDMTDFAGIAPGSIDVVIANPPYKTSRWRPDFEPILARVGLDRFTVAATNVTPDLIFLAQALYLVRPGGRLALIVPDTLISGARMAGVREALARDHALERVIQLPRRAFRGTDAQAHVLILRAGAPVSRVLLDRIRADGSWEAPIRIPSSDAAERLDYAFHDARRLRGGPGAVTLRDLGVKVVRGRASSTRVRAAAGAIFHTNSFPEKRGGAVSFPEVIVGYDNEIFATAGDILLARVHRRLEEKIAHVTAGMAPISDCVFRLRCDPFVAPRVLRGISDPFGTAQLQARARGVGARALTMADVLDITV